MKKWQELSLNALMNFSVAIMAGVLRLILDFQNVVASVVSAFAGAYMLFSVVLLAKNIEEKD